MGLFDRFKKKEEKEPRKKEKAPSKGKIGKEKKKGETRDFDPSKVPSGKGVKEKLPQKPSGKEKAKKAKKEDTGDAYRILVKPLLTEKATDLGAYGQYIFAVAPQVNKPEIKKAIHDLYGVNVVKINVINQRGRTVQYGRSTGQTKHWKKAIVTLKPGEKIEIYEGV